MNTDPFVYGQNGGGGRNVGLDVRGVRVLLQSDGAAEDERVLRLARDIQAGVAALDAERARAAEATRRTERLARELDTARAALGAATTGRRRFFGPVLCRPATPGDWSGPVWLLDPEKGERGSGLRFASLAELRAVHPELWIVGCVDGGVLLDACALRQVLPAEGAR